jgi:hypothetical protein
MEIKKTDWASYKALLVAKNPNWQHDEGADSYLLFFEDGLVLYNFELPKTSPPSEDQLEWEADFKPRSNFAIGKRAYAFASGDFDFAGDAIEGVCPAGDPLVLDYVFTEALYITGGSIILGGSVVGDWIEAHVVHPVYGVVKTYVEKRFVPASPDGYPSPIMELKTPYAGMVPAGLALRLVFHSTGVAPVNVGLNLDLHRNI